jgi:cell division protease FtsH
MKHLKIAAQCILFLLVTATAYAQELKNIKVGQEFTISKALLKDKHQELEIIAQALLKREVIFQHDLESLIGKRPYEKETTYQSFTKDETPPITEGLPLVEPATGTVIPE